MSFFHYQMNHFTVALLEWYGQNGRSLPWRETCDPYAIWLSEIILQQTRVQQGMDYWRRFVDKWPNVNMLAGASEDEVLKMWQGLGYYSRARNLHAAAAQIVALGHFPDTYEEIRGLKGVGDYTAAAIASFALALPHAAVDGNVYRVLGRVFGIATPINSTQGKKEFAALAQSLLPAGRAADFNQAMMDFGSLQCTPKSPKCLECPMQDFCVAWREGRVGELPVKLRKIEVRERWFTYYYLRCGGFTAVRQRSRRDIWQGLWEPYLEEDAQPPLEKAGSLSLLASGVRHVLTHRVIVADFYLWQVDERPVLPEGYIWIPEEDVSRYAVPRLVQRLLELLPDA